MELDCFFLVLGWGLSGFFCRSSGGIFFKVKHGGSDSKDWRVIFTALDGVREVLKQVFSGRKETLSQSVGSKYAPGIDERYFISKINTLQELCGVKR